MNLFNLEAEKYWDFTAKYTKEQRKKEIENCIASDDYIASLKKDGHYNRFVKYNNECRLESRTVSKVTGECGNKAEHCPHILPTLNNLPNGTVLIGELYQEGKESKDMTSILQCLPNKSIERQKSDYGWVSYYIHDIWFANGEDLRNTSYEKRIEILKSYFNTYLTGNKYLEIAEYATDPDSIRELLAWARENDEEGIVMVRKDAKVSCGARTAWKTLKVKKELENEVDCFFTGGYKESIRLYTGKQIENWMYWQNLKTDELIYGAYYNDYDNGATIEPVTKSFYYGWAGSAEVGLLKDGKPIVFGYVSGLSDFLKEDLVSNPEKYKNKPCTLTGMQFTDDKKLRHPKFLRFREDLNITDCQWEKIFG